MMRKTKCRICKFRDTDLLDEPCLSECTGFDKFEPIEMGA